MTKKTAVVTVIYKKGLRYFREFLISAGSQKVKTFDLLLFNSDMDNEQAKRALRIAEKHLPERVKMFSAKAGSIAGVWNKVIRCLMGSKYQNIVFSDMDDIMAPDKVKSMSSALSKDKVVFSDVDLFKDKASRRTRGYFGKRIPNLVDWRFLLDKNCIGLGSSAIRRSVLFRTNIPKDIIAVDWFLFVSVLIKRRLKARYLNKGLTYYRQYADNISGIENVTSERILKALSVKKAHYAALSNAFGDITEFKELALKCGSLKINNSYLSKMKEKYSGKKPLWWQYAEIDKKGKRYAL